MKLPKLRTLVLAATLLWAVAALLPGFVFGLKTTTALGYTEAKAALRALRQSFDSGQPLRLPDELLPFAEDRPPLVLTAWSEGKRKAVFQVGDLRLADGLRQLGQELGRANIAKSQESRARLQLDVGVAEGWLPDSAWIERLAFAEGHDSLSGLVNGQRVYVPPAELIRKEKYRGISPLRELVPRFLRGFEHGAAVSAVAEQAEDLGLAKKREPVSALRRFRAIAVAEGMDRVPRALLKGTVERPALSRQSGRAAVIAGAEYLARALGEDGRYHYYYDPLRDRDERDEYNWPRHAGVSYSMALVGQLVRRPDFVQTAARALLRFEAQLAAGPDGSRCLRAQGKCYLGSSALGLLALAEYRIASGDPRFDRVQRDVARFLLTMQREDGFFYHDWRKDQGIDRKLMKLYASQQAVLALARHARALGDVEAKTAAIKGMDYLAGPYWDHFLGRYFFGQEHWTCLAAEELYAAAPKREYADLCYRIGQHYDRITLGPDDTPFSEDVGGMSVTPFFTPHLGGTATAAEAMVSSVVLARAAGLDDTAIRAKLVHTLGYLVKGQLSPNDAFWIPRPEIALGGFPDSQSRIKIRIDTVQHAISALVRGLDLIP